MPAEVFFEYRLQVEASLTLNTTKATNFHIGGFYADILFSLKV
jgi:hypothetical protein